MRRASGISRTPTPSRSHRRQGGPGGAGSGTLPCRRQRGHCPRRTAPAPSRRPHPDAPRVCGQHVARGVEGRSLEYAEGPRPALTTTGWPMVPCVTRGFGLRSRPGPLAVRRYRAGAPSTPSKPRRAPAEPPFRRRSPCGAPPAPRGGESPVRASYAKRGHGPSNDCCHCGSGFVKASGVHQSGPRVCGCLRVVRRTVSPATEGISVASWNVRGHSHSPGLLSEGYAAAFRPVPTLGAFLLLLSH